MIKNNSKRKPIVKLKAFIPVLFVVLYLGACCPYSAALRKNNSMFSVEKSNDKSANTINKEEKVLHTADRMPQYSGGYAGLTKAIEEKIVYPQSARNQGIQGIVLVGFVVNKIGEVKDVKILKKVHPDLDKEALRVVKALPHRWIPGNHKGKRVSVFYSVQVVFNL